MQTLTSAPDLPFDPHAHELSYQLEQIECSYWVEYYKRDTIFTTYASTIGDGIMCAIPGVDVLAMNRVIGLGTKSAIDQPTLERIIYFYKTVGSSRFFIQLAPYAVDERTVSMLEHHGFKNYNQWTKLYREVEPIKPLWPSSLEIRSIDISEADLYGQLIFESFDWEDSRLVSWLASTVGVTGYRHYIVSKDGKAIAAGALYVKGVMASMAFAGTLKQYRGLGAQRLLLETRLNDAYKLGAKIITSETAKHTAVNNVTSFKNLLKVGFKTAYHRQNWLYKF